LFQTKGNEVFSLPPCRGNVRCSAAEDDRTTSVWGQCRRCW